MTVINGRSRINSGEIRTKRSDTLIGTIEERYARDFAVRSDMKLGNFLRMRNFSSLSQLLKSDVGRRKL